MDPNSEHPTEQFSFVVLTAEVETFRAELEEALRLLAQSRNWVIAPPALFDLEAEDDEEDGPTEEDAGEDEDSEEDYPLGGYLDLYSAIQGPPLPYEVDKRHFEEVTALIHLLERFSIKHGLEIEFYLGPELIGKLVWGLQDESLRVGLLEEWGRVLEMQKKKELEAGTLGSADAKTNE